MSAKLQWFLVTWIAWQCGSCSIPLPGAAKPLLCKAQEHHEQYDKKESAMRRVGDLGPTCEPGLAKCSGLRCEDLDINWHPEAK